MRAPHSASLRPVSIPGFSFSCADAGHSSPESDIFNTPLSDFTQHLHPKTSPLRHSYSLSDFDSRVFVESSPTAHYTFPTSPQVFKPHPHKSKRTLHSVNEDPFSRSFPSYEELTLSTPNMSFDQSSYAAYFDAECSSSPRQAFSTIPNVKADLHSPQFPPGHLLNPFFAKTYLLEDELGAGGYGFVMTARNRTEGHEVAVKFVIKEKVPEGAWMEDEEIGRLPTEIFLLSYINHENIVKCLDLFEDELYFYLVQELHGSPWPKTNGNLSSQRTSSPLLSPSVSEDSLPDLGPYTPPQSCVQLNTLYSGPHTQEITNMHHHFDQDMPEPQQPQASSSFTRRPSYDLFECIEHKHLSEIEVRYIFAQVVEAVYYLESRGITHRDIKDENIVIDKDYKVKVIDFGSAIIVDTKQPRPWYTNFFGTAAYAAPEILLKKRYQAAPAEVWTLGILLSYLLNGTAPFPTVRDAIDGRIVLPVIPGRKLSRGAMCLLRRCLDVDPKRRADISEVRAHRWLRNRN